MSNNSTWQGHSEPWVTNIHWSEADKHHIAGAGVCSANSQKDYKIQDRV